MKRSWSSAVHKVQEIFKNMNLIPCTGPVIIAWMAVLSRFPFPIYFAVMNTKQIYHDWNADYYYNVVHTAPGRKASDCIQCRKMREGVSAALEYPPAAGGGGQ